MFKSLRRSEAKIQKTLLSAKPKVGVAHFGAECTHRKLSTQIFLELETLMSRNVLSNLLNSLSCATLFLDTELMCVMCVMWVGSKNNGRACQHCDYYSIIILSPI